MRPWGDWRGRGRGGFFKASSNPLLVCKTQDWEAHRDIIFPSVVDTSGFRPAAGGRYFMYYSIHDAPGGIGLATADHLSGPWTKHPGNPVLVVNRRPNQDRSAHVSSPEVVWVEATRTLHLYYHGLAESPDQVAAQVTFLATSTDGLRWRKHGPPLLDSPVSGAWNGNELSYARVTWFGDRYCMLYMARSAAPSAPVLGFATSVDGVAWEKSAQPFLHASSRTQAFISTGQLVTLDADRTLLFYADEDDRARNTCVHVALTRDGGATWRGPVLALSPGRLWHWDRVRNHDPFAIVRDGVIYLYYAGGRRQGARGIGLATASVTELLDRLEKSDRMGIGNLSASTTR